MGGMNGASGVSKSQLNSIDWFKKKNAGKSHISWKNLWFSVDFPLSQPIESLLNVSKKLWKIAASHGKAHCFCGRVQ